MKIGYVVSSLFLILLISLVLFDSTHRIGIKDETLILPARITLEMGDVETRNPMPKQRTPNFNEESRKYAYRKRESTSNIHDVRPNDGFKKRNLLRDEFESKAAQFGTIPEINLSFNGIDPIELGRQFGLKLIITRAEKIVCGARLGNFEPFEIGIEHLVSFSRRGLNANGLWFADVVKKKVSEFTGYQSDSLDLIFLIPMSLQEEIDRVMLSYMRQNELNPSGVDYLTGIFHSGEDGIEVRIVGYKPLS